MEEILERLERIEAVLAAPPREYLDTEEAARFLGLSATALEHWRTRREGPPFVKVGRAVRYSIAELRDFMSAHRLEPLE